MTYFALSQNLAKVREEIEAEVNFLFESLFVSLRVAKRHAGVHNLNRALPSTKHALNLTSLLHAQLKKIPVDSIQENLDELFTYMHVTLEENLKLPIAEDLDELLLLSAELEKGIATLLEPVEIDPIVQLSANGRIIAQHEALPANSN